MSTTRRRTLRDIADALDVSINTVSRALADKDNVSAATRQMIKDEAQRIGYIPNVQARSLVLGSVMTIGLVITNPSNPFYAQLISAIEFAARARGYSLVLGISEESPEVESATVDALLRGGVDGAIVVPVQAGHDPWIRLRRAGIPGVLVNRDLVDSGWDLVGTDNTLGTRLATESLLRRGRRSIVLLEEDLPITTIQERVDGFQQALAAAGLSGADNVITVPTRRKEDAALPWQADEGYRLARDFLGNRHIDGVVVGNDYFALGLYKAIAERGLSIPDDIAVVGFGDYPFAAYLTPALSTVSLPAAQVGRTAVDLLLRRLESRDAEVEHVQVPPTLIERESSQPSAEENSRRSL